MPALTRFPSTYAVKDLGTLVYSSDGNLVDKATSEWEKHVVTMHLPLGVEIEAAAAPCLLGLFEYWRRDPSPFGLKLSQPRPAPHQGSPAKAQEHRRGL